MAEKEEEYNGMTIEDAVKKLQEQKNEILDAFAKAYLAETALLPSAVELVCTEEKVDNIITTVYTFRRKSEPGSETQSE